MFVCELRAFRQFPSIAVVFAACVRRLAPDNGFDETVLMGFFVNQLNDDVQDVLATADL